MRFELGPESSYAMLGVQPTDLQSFRLGTSFTTGLAFTLEVGLKWSFAQQRMPSMINDVTVGATPHTQKYQSSTLAVVALTVLVVLAVVFAVLVMLLLVVVVALGSPAS